MGQLPPFYEFLAEQLDFLTLVGIADLIFV